MQKLIRYIKEVNGIIIFIFILATFSFSIPFIDRYFSYPFPRIIIYEIQDSGFAFVVLILSIISLIWIKKKKRKGKWFAIVAIILAGISSLYV